MAIIACTLTVLPAAAQFYPNGRPIPPGKRTGHHRYGHQAYRHDGNTYGGFRVGFGVSTVNSDAPLFDSNKSSTGLAVGLAVGTQVSNRAPLFLESGYTTRRKAARACTTTRSSPIRSTILNCRWC